MSGVDPAAWAQGLGVGSAEELRAYVAALARHAEQIETDLTGFRAGLVSAPAPQVRGRLGQALILVGSAVADLREARRRLAEADLERLWDER